PGRGQDRPADRRERTARPGTGGPLDAGVPDGRAAHRRRPAQAGVHRRLRAGSRQGAVTRMDVGLVTAFLGGALALLSPCAALLMPAFFASTAGSGPRLLAHGAV